MAIWRLIDISKISAQHGLQFKWLDLNPESMFGVVTLYNSSQDILTIGINLGGRAFYHNEVNQIYDWKKIDLDQADYLNEIAGGEIADWLANNR